MASMALEIHKPATALLTHVYGLLSPSLAARNVGHVGWPPRRAFNIYITALLQSS